MGKKRKRRRYGHRSWLQKYGAVLALVVVAVAAVGASAFALNRDAPVAGGTTRATAEDLVPEAEVTSVAWLGDSYLRGTPEGFTTLVSNDQGWTPTLFGQGGTGYVSAGPAPAESYLARVDEVIAAGPDVVVVFGGRNDLAYDLDTVRTNVHATYTALRAGLPDARIIAVGPLWSDAAIPDRLFQIRDTIREEVAAVGGEHIDALDDNWFATPDGLNQPDNVHPSDAGQKNIADRLSAALG